MEHSMNDISIYRYNSCGETLHSAEIMHSKGRYVASLDRSFFSLFNGVRAIIAFDGIKSIDHSEVTDYFIQNYVKENEIFADETAKWLAEAVESKEKEDWLDFYYPSEEESMTQIKRAKAFKAEVQKYLISKGILEDKN
ncbi:MAG: HEPN domain-containing protein [Clostridiales bacterium]|nr:HEPN domain-containing protein [Clostridiales bacterium]